MAYEFREFIITNRDLCKELNAACDAYKGREINDLKFRDIVIHYATKYPALFFNGSDFNPTVKLIVRKRRLSLIKHALDGFQSSLFHVREN